MSVREIPVAAVLEGATDSAVAERLLEHVGLTLGDVYGLRGKAHNDQRLHGYNNAARFAPWFVLRDLDRDAPCAPTLVKALLPAPSLHMRFRVAVHQMEAWLLADAGAMSSHLSVPLARIPTSPDALANPKATLVRLARGSSKRAVRRDMAPRAGSGAMVGPGYTTFVAAFARDRWRPAVAAAQSPSLAKCIAALKTLR